MTNNPKIIIPQGALPEKFEISAAQILAKHFNCDVAFLPVTSSKTPDIVIGNIRWEIKSPLGKGKHNIQHQFHRAMKQSKNVVIDARRSKIDVRNIRRELKQQAELARGLKRLILITKEEKVEVIK
jgi:hypothetical protein